MSAPALPIEPLSRFTEKVWFRSIRPLEWVTGSSGNTGGNGSGTTSSQLPVCTASDEALSFAAAASSAVSAVTV